jgi:hypothetical protein
VSSRRAYAAALVVLTAGALLLLWGYGLVWGTAEVPLLAGAADTTRTQELTGRALYPGAAMAGWVALGAVGGVVATRSWGRVVVATIGLLSGIVGAGAAIGYAIAPAAAIDASVGVAGQPAVAAEPAVGWVVAAIAGLSVVVASCWTLLSGRRWPTLGARYERGSRPERALSAWEAQDKGQDPTDDLVE